MSEEKIKQLSRDILISILHQVYSNRESYVAKPSDFHLGQLLDSERVILEITNIIKTHLGDNDEKIQKAIYKPE